MPGTTQEDVGGSRVNYALLDRADQTARIRPNSTAVNVRHDSNPESARQVVVTHSRGGKLFEVRGRHVVMACWNGVKGPLVHLTIAGVFRLRRTRPDVPRPSKAFGYPVAPALYIATATAILVVLAVYRPTTTWPGFATV